jgi:DNA-binding protein H-NS
MSIDKLAALREQVEAAIATKVIEERRTLQVELVKLSRYSGRRGSGERGLRGGRVAPKYRNPANPSETWAGRGLKPRWLAAALKSGKKLEDFAIAGARKAAKKK